MATLNKCATCGHSIPSSENVTTGTCRSCLAESLIRNGFVTLGPDPVPSEYFGYSLADVTVVFPKWYEKPFWTKRMMKRLAVIAVVVLVGVVAYFEHDRRVTANAERLYLEGVSRGLKNDDAGAIERFSESIKLRPTPLAYNARGFTHYRMGRYDLAISDCDEALKLDPTNKAAKKNRELAARYVD